MLSLRSDSFASCTLAPEPERFVASRESLTKHALGIVGMHHAMDRPMGGYSRGMRQRTKLAQAIAHDPPLLILDEPFNGLDPIGRHELTELLRGLIDQGTSVLLASHILHEVEAITQSFLLICNGRLLASGSSEEVQTLLADIPNEIRIRCDRAYDLARRLLAEEVVDEVRFEVDSDVLILATRHPAAIYSKLPQLVEQADCRIHELQSANESLDVLFASLLRIHRGEM